MGNASTNRLNPSPLPGTSNYKVSDKQLRSRYTKALQFTQKFMIHNIINQSELRRLLIGGIKTASARVSHVEFYSIFGRPDTKNHIWAKRFFNHIPNYAPGVKCSTYSVEVDKLIQLYTILYPNDNAPVIQRSIIGKFDEELLTGKFQYKTVGNRRYHPLQNISSVNRFGDIFQPAGYTYEYDIISAIVALPLAAAKLQYDLTVYSNEVAIIENYLSNVDKFRTNLCNELRLPRADIKTLITSTMNISRIVKYGKFHKPSNIYSLLGCDDSKFTTFVNIIQPLHYATGIIWRLLAVTPTGVITSKLRHSIYTGLELQLQFRLEAYCCENNIRCFFIHDGFITDSSLENFTELKQLPHMCYDVRQPPAG